MKIDKNNEVDQKNIKASMTIMWRNYVKQHGMF